MLFDLNTSILYTPLTFPLIPDISLFGAVLNSTALLPSENKALLLEESKAEGNG